VGGYQIKVLNSAKFLKSFIFLEGMIYFSSAEKNNLPLNKISVSNIFLEKLFK
jgi:hypothetical protein